MNSFSNLDKKQLEKSKVATWRDLPAIVFTFILVLIAWVFFKADSATEAFAILKKIFFEFNLTDVQSWYPKRLLIVLFLLLVEWFQRDKLHPLHIGFLPKAMRYLIYGLIIFAILFLGTYDYSPFIYFKF